jgi:hypothetical protein
MADHHGGSRRREKCRMIRALILGLALFFEGAGERGPIRPGYGHFAPAR